MSQKCNYTTLKYANRSGKRKDQTMKEYAKEFYKSRAWKNCRDSYLKSVGGLCEICAKYGKVTPAEEVHHIRHINEKNITDPNITLAWSNLCAVCRECHRREHSKHKTNQRYTIGDNGVVIPIL